MPACHALEKSRRNIWPECIVLTGWLLAQEPPRLAGALRAHQCGGTFLDLPQLVASRPKAAMQARSRRARISGDCFSWARSMPLHSWRGAHVTALLSARVMRVSRRVHRPPDSCVLCSGLLEAQLHLRREAQRPGRIMASFSSLLPTCLVAMSAQNSSTALRSSSSTFSVLQTRVQPTGARNLSLHSAMLSKTHSRRQLGS